jgi:PEP-CTERM motif
MRSCPKSLLAVCAGLFATATFADDGHKSFAELGAMSPSSHSFKFSNDKDDKDDWGKSWQSQSIPKLDTKHGWSHGVPSYGKGDHDFGKFDFGKYGHGKDDYDWKDYDYCTPVPEPSTYAMMALGLVGVGVYARRRKTA